MDAPDTAEILRVVGQMFAAMADALDEDDGILGSIAGMGLYESLPALPKHIRDVIAELVTDDAARSWRADYLYIHAGKSALPNQSRESAA